MKFPGKVSSNTRLERMGDHSSVKIIAKCGLQSSLSHYFFEGNSKDSLVEALLSLKDNLTVEYTCKLYFLGKSGTVARKVLDTRHTDAKVEISVDHDENKYQRRGAVDWFTKWFG